MFASGIRLFSVFSLLLVLLLPTLGCGGSGTTSAEVSGRGRVTLTITWPASRAIPAATRSIKIVAKVLEPADGSQVAEQVVQRPENQPTSQVVLDDLPSVKVRITATAFESTNGTGDVLASGSTEVDVPESNSVTANIVLEAEDSPCEAPFAQVTNSETEPDTVVTGTTSANISVPGSSVSVNLTTITASSSVTANTPDFSANAQFIDYFMVVSSSPEAVFLNLVFEISTVVGEGANAEYKYTLLASGTLNTPYEVFGDFREGVLINGVPPVNQEVKIPVVVLPGFFSGIDIRLENRTFQEGDFLSNSIRFKRIEGLPAGATVRTRSCTGWLGG
jgi:hypothetical protein